jgi:malate dehydrogenase (oxaloacetate-decarboxylating)(NADP+)
MRKPIRISEYGRSILEEGLFNKGTSFGIGERDRLGLRGLIPSQRLSMQQQLNRVRFQLEKEDSDIRRYQYLRDLQDRNETLFHRVLLDNIEDLAPIVYTPTVGQACLEFGSSFRRPRGMYFCDYDRGDMGSMMYNWPGRDVHVAVITDGGRVLGLGDLGANGMAITIGKLALYCSAGGIAPHRVLPIMFDAGTNNEEIRNSEFYLGQPTPRLDGDEYYTLLDELMFSLTNRFPNIFIQFEDFSSDRALDVLQRYRYQTLCFNDDIQGTGAVAVAGILSALEAQEKSPDALKDQTFVIAGSGSAGLGVVNALCESMVVQGSTMEEARSKFWVCDIDGVLGANRPNGKGPPLTEDQLCFARNDDTVGMNIEEVVKAVKPSVLIGLSTVSGLFNENIVREMAKNNDHPIIFPLSNPTASAECTAENAYRWTEGRAIFGSGSPFDPVQYNGRIHTPSQVNNMFIFPGLGLGATLCGAK